MFIWHALAAGITTIWDFTWAHPWMLAVLAVAPVAALVLDIRDDGRRAS